MTLTHLSPSHTPTWNLKKISPLGDSMNGLCPSPPPLSPVVLQELSPPTPGPHTLAPERELVAQKLQRSRAEAGGQLHRSSTLPPPARQALRD